MRPAEVYGLMLIKGVRADEIARAVPCHVDLVHKAIRGERRGPQSTRALELLARRLEVPPATLCDPPPSMADDSST